jgi:hypothetical protein
LNLNIWNPILYVAFPSGNPNARGRQVIVIRRPKYTFNRVKMAVYLLSIKINLPWDSIVNLMMSFKVRLRVQIVIRFTIESHGKLIFIESK